MSSTVGLPAPARERDVVEAERRTRPRRSSVPPKRTPPNMRELARGARAAGGSILRKFLSQRTVMPYSATPPNPAITRSSSGSCSSSTSRIGLERHALAVRRPRRRARGGSGSIFSPSMPTTVWPSFIRWCASVKPAGPMPTTSTRLPVGGLRQRAAQVERVPAREQRVDLEAPRQLEHVLQRARLGLRDVDRLLLLVDARLHAVVADAVPGGRDHRVVDRDDRRARRSAGPRVLTLWNSEIFSSSGQPASGTPNDGLLERRRVAVRRRLFLQPLRAGVLALLVAPDAVVAPRRARRRGRCRGR